MMACYLKPRMGQVLFASKRVFSAVIVLCCGLLWPAAASPIEPANPHATAEARQILAYLSGLPNRADKRVLSGQTGGWADHVARDYKQCVEQLHEQTSKWVAMVAFDYIGFTPDVNKYAQRAWKDGSLVMVSWHANNPWTGKGYSDRQIGSGLREAITPGTDAHKRWLAMLDTTAERLNELAANNGVVLWRPFHEMNSSGFWWCRRDQADFVALWRHMFEYFTNVKKLNHLLWVYSPDDGYGNEFSGLHYYPGDAYVDIVGLDKYLYFLKKSSRVGQAGG